MNIPAVRGATDESFEVRGEFNSPTSWCPHLCAGTTHARLPSRVSDHWKASSTVSTGANISERACSAGTAATL